MGSLMSDHKMCMRTALINYRDICPRSGRGSGSSISSSVSCEDVPLFCDCIGGLTFWVYSGMRSLLCFKKG